MRPVLRPAGGGLRPQPPDRRRCGRAAPPHPGGSAEHLALRRLPAPGGWAAGALGAAGLAGRAAGGLHAADSRRPSRAAAGVERGVGQERRRQPHALLQGPRGVGGGGARAGAWLPDDRVRLHRQPGQLRGRPRGGAGPRVLRLHPRRPGGAEGARDRRLRHPPGGGEGQLRRRQPPLHGALRRARVGVRERQPAPLLRRGLEDAGVRDRRAARLGAARPLRRADRLGIAVHEDRQGLRRVARARPRERRAAAHERRAGRGLRARWRARMRPATTCAGR